MFDRLPDRRKAASRILAVASLLWLAACDPGGLLGGATDSGPQVDPNAPVQVALLVPGNTGNPGDSILSRDLENAARLAIADLDGPQIDLRVYSTGTDAGAIATRAANEGAQIILGPLRGEQANAAGLALAGTDINILAFTNNSTVAGGNVFVLGPTFRNTAERLVRYGTATGIADYAIVHGDDLQGNVGRDAIASAVRANGATLTGVYSYPLSQQGIVSSAPSIANAIAASGPGAVFLTGGVNADLPLIATALPENGIDPAITRYMGLTRWDVAPQALSLPGLQGGLFTLPDQSTISRFESRYAAAYGGQPHVLAGLAYDGIAAIGALLAQGDSGALTRRSLTQAQGFQGTSGIFRLLPDGTNERGLAVATIRNNQVVILDAAPRSFGGQGS